MSKLPKTTLVTILMSATTAGFHWEIEISSAEPKNSRVRSGDESTRDHTERIEVVKDRDILLTVAVRGHERSSVECRVTVGGGLQKKHQVAATNVRCAQNVPALFDSREYE